MSRERTPSPTRWLLLVIMLGACGWGAFTLYERMTRDGGARAAEPPPKDDRLEQLLAEGYKQLASDALDNAEDQFKKASGVAEKDARVQEGLVLVAVLRAEHSYLEIEAGNLDEGKKKARLEQLDAEVHAAREAIAGARRLLTDPAPLERLRAEERRINVMVLLAFAHAGDLERARGTLSARLADHPQRALLEAYLGVSAPPASSSSAAASASGSASAAPSAAPSGSAPSAQPGYEERRDYELDDEPNLGEHPTTPGELQLPSKRPAPTDDMP